MNIHHGLITKLNKVTQKQKVDEHIHNQLLSVFNGQINTLDALATIKKTIIWKTANQKTQTTLLRLLNSYINYRLTPKPTPQITVIHLEKPVGDIFGPKKNNPLHISESILKHIQSEGIVSVQELLNNTTLHSRAKIGVKKWMRVQDCVKQFCMQYKIQIPHYRESSASDIINKKDIQE